MFSPKVKVEDFELPELSLPTDVKRVFEISNFDQDFLSLRNKTYAELINVSHPEPDESFASSWKCVPSPSHNQTFYTSEETVLCEDNLVENGLCRSQLSFAALNLNNFSAEITPPKEPKTIYAKPLEMQNISSDSQGIGAAMTTKQNDGKENRASTSKKRQNKTIKPPNAYYLFWREKKHRIIEDDEVAKQYANLTKTQINKKILNEWRATPNTKKIKYYFKYYYPSNGNSNK